MKPQAEAGQSPHAMCTHLILVHWTPFFFLYGALILIFTSIVYSVLFSYRLLCPENRLENASIYP